MYKWQITFDLDEAEKNLLYKGLEELKSQGSGTASVIVALKAKIDLAWIEGPERRIAAVEVLAKLQTIRGNLFRLKGYLDAVGCSPEAFNWVVETLEIVKALQREVWKCQSTR